MKTFLNQTVRVGFMLVVPIFLAGCMAAVLAPMVPLVGGMSSSSNKVSVDEATVTPELKEALTSAKRLTFVGGDRGSVFMAEYLDDQQAYEVRILPGSPMSTPSQRREDMRKVCVNVSAPDLVLSSSLGHSDAGTGTTMGALFTGRANFNVRATIDVLRCRDSWTGRFAVAAEISQGMYNVDRANVDQVIGQEIAKALMVLGGKAPRSGTGPAVSPTSGNTKAILVAPAAK